MLKATILTYHDVLPSNAHADGDNASLLPYVLPADVFEQHMAFISSEGRHVESLETLIRRSGKGSVKSSNIVITFDDGWLNNYHVAYPLLKMHGFSATFFVIVGKVGASGMMTWEQLRELADNNMTIGSHTLTHRYPAELSDKEIDYELIESKRILESGLGRKVNILSIPTGFHNQKMLKAAKDAGYLAVCSGVEGVTNIDEDLFNLRSFCIRNGISDKEFIGLLHNDQTLIAARRIRQLIFKIAKNAFGVKGYNTIRGAILGRTPKMENVQ